MRALRYPSAAIVVSLFCALPASAAEPEPRADPPRGSAAVVVSSLLLPAFVATAEHEVAPATYAWMTAGIGRARAMRPFSETVGRTLVTGGVGIRRTLARDFFVHGDLTWVHVGGERDEVVVTTSGLSDENRRIAALFAPGLSLGAGFGAALSFDRAFVELTFVARWVFAARPAHTAEAPNVYAKGALALLPAVAVGWRW
ncbi:MAG: hypothetical protein HYV09_40410 [Deltaproteobacteria bacterium]|nr:hypothetical protein [Deltaproteobacteria bacterium]